MSGCKNLTRVAVAVTALMLILTILLLHGAALGVQDTAQTAAYETKLFDQSRVHTIDLVLDDWDEFLEHAASEEYEIAKVVIDGEVYSNVGIRAKGNTSLSMVAAMDSDRYSLKLEFDHYDSGQSYYGLDKLCLNNLIQDSTMMKDYLTYTMMREFGVHAPLCSYVYLTVNGADFGLYLAVEGVEEAFLTRNYGADYGELYKPDSTNMGGGTEQPQGLEAPDSAVDGELSFAQMEPPDMAGSPGGGAGTGGTAADVKLQYIDADLSSYRNLWDNAKTDITEADQTRLVASLKKLSEQEDLDAVVDMDQVIRYFVVHNYVCNGDSYTGSMVHNYYLYEESGQLAMIPWDYNLAFGTFQGGNASDVVNTPIDAPVENGTGEDRPMWNWILSDETYTEQYHQAMQAFLDEVDVTEEIDQAYALIRDYVAEDPTAFYSETEFEAGVETLRQFCALRSASITQQLAAGETTQNMGYADASAIHLSDMGTMNGTGDESRGTMPRPDSSNSMAPGSAESTTEPQEGEPPALPDMEESGDAEVSADETFPTEPQAGEPPALPDAEEAGDTEVSTDGTFPAQPEAGSDAMRPSGAAMQPTGDRDATFGVSDDSDGAAWIWMAASAVVLAVGLWIAKRYPR